MKYIYINFIQLTVTNFFVVIGILPFLTLGLNLNSFIYGYYFMNAKITRVKHIEIGGKQYSTCYNTIYFLDKNGIESSVGEKCENISGADVNKNIYVRIDNAKDKTFLRISTPTPMFNSIISIEGKEINSKYNLPWFDIIMSFLGFVMFICWLKYSLIPRIRGTHPLQIALKNKSNIKNQIK